MGILLYRLHIIDIVSNVLGHKGHNTQLVPRPICPALYGYNKREQHQTGHKGTKNTKKRCAYIQVIPILYIFEKAIFFKILCPCAPIDKKAIFQALKVTGHKRGTSGAQNLCPDSRLTFVGKISQKVTFFTFFHFESDVGL